MHGHNSPLANKSHRRLDGYISGFVIVVVNDDVAATAAAANVPFVKMRTTTATTITARVLIIAVLFIHILK